MITVVCGPMYASKSTELVRRVRRLLVSGRTPLVVKPAIDDRYAKDAVVTHDGLLVPCSYVRSSEEVRSLAVMTGNEGTHALRQHVFVDEAQFFDADIVHVTAWLSAMGVDVVLCGLDLDAMGNPFGPMADLLCHADTVVKLTAVCSVCGKDATRTQRTAPWPSEKTGNIDVGNAYEPRCVVHWKPTSEH